VTGVAADDAATDKAATDRLTALGLQNRFTAQRTRATTAATAEVVRLFASPVMGPPAGSATIANAALTELEAEQTLDLAAVLRVAGRYRSEHFGEGVLRLEKLNPKLTDAAVVQGLAKTRAVPELDRLGRLLADADAKALAAAAETGARQNPDNLRTQILQQVQGLPS
jgi:hypothetical protein